ncbi:MAG: hypothetical protein KW804_03035 [Candidatus Doudnabacteria bacterium]|nr:hypothetical protein [Candidatus Doudnabacteria bacterium]
MKNTIIIILTLVMLGLTVGSFAVAQKSQEGLVSCGRNDSLPANPTVQQRKEKQCKLSDLIYLLARIINFLLAWAWLISIFYIMWAGYNMITAAGNAEGIATAKTTFSHAIIGFFLIMGSYLLINWIVSLLTGDSTPRAGSLKNILDLFGL